MTSFCNNFQQLYLYKWFDSHLLGLVSFYDEKARPVQVQSTNITGDSDIITTQYGFIGQPLLGITREGKAGTNAQTSIALTRMTYDSLGRMVRVEKRVSNTKVNTGSMPSSWKIVVQNDYNAVGQLKKKKLGATPLDSLTFDYNIRGWMLGINRNYVKDTMSVANWFGFDLAYDKSNFNISGSSKSYAAAQYNGNIAGTLWKSTGDDELRKYDFTYDETNRLTGADFNQLTANNFSKNALVDFSVSGLNYDANGNILNMYQKGWKVGGSIMIDSLYYTYLSNSNRLKNVLDYKNDTITKLGDFRSSTAYMNTLGGTKTSSASDYSYDANANMNIDNNKDIGNIHYNYLNLPDSITLTGKSNIKYIYDATGNKLKKITTEGSLVTTTLYLFCNYVNDTLQSLSHEEGRVRFNVSDSSLYYDYFIKDHVGNVRMVLTEQTKTDAYPAASLETAQLTTERMFYSKIDSGKVNKSSVSGYPSDTYTTPNDFIQKLNGSGVKIGTGIVLKVMAGDQFNLRVNSWWNSGSTPSTPISPLIDLINAMAGSVGGLGGSHATSQEITASGILSPNATNFLNSQSGYSTSKPKAFVNWILFDERFNFVSACSGFEQVGASNSFTTHTRTNQALNKSGYLYIYVSNETPNIDVFYDNLQVTHIRGPLLDETHYYPFGLTMGGISSKALVFGSPQNKNKFYGAELNTDFDLNQYELFYRNYDPQIGRWHSVDTKPVDRISLYAAMANNPIRYTDPLGDTAVYFRPDGSFWKFQDDGKKEYSGVFFQKSEVTSTYEKDGEQYAVNTYSDAINFQFNDPSVDVQAIKNGAITQVENMSDSKVESQIDKSGVKSSDAQAHPFSFANTEGRQGKMDYGVNGMNSRDLSSNTFYIRNKTAYNVGDIGNYLWGRAMAELEFDLGAVSVGAHINNFFNGRSDKTPQYDFGPGTYGSPGVFDSKGDQRAIVSGYLSNPKYPMLKQKEYDRYKGIPYTGH